MNVVRDDRHGDLAVVPLGGRIAAAAVDRESQVGRERVVEQLDPLALGREHRRDSRILPVVLDVEAGRFERGEGLHAKRHVIDDRAFRARRRFALPKQHV